MIYNLITVLGPTACGKTKLTARLADHFNGEVISADSRQVYKRMNIGTGKDLQEFFLNSRKIPYHLIDIVEPEEEFNLFLFTEHFSKAFHSILEKQKTPFLTGGTGMYLSAVLQNYQLAKTDFHSKRKSDLEKFPADTLAELLLSLNPKLHNTTDLLDRERLIKAILVAEASSNDEANGHMKVSSFTIGIQPERKILKERISERLKLRLQNGMIEEVERLVTEGISFEKLNFFGLEYRYIGLYLQKKLTYNDMFQKLRGAINQFAKRQMTWFRKMEREDVPIYWLPEADFSEAKNLIESKCPLFH
ncbi:MAG: tRNA (adenosine(37)-N6)-dimethylallyltransferase MiaA [Ignavibacteriaceae bacterium]|nr:tRNA (adenosine(37)-N6)-dimethylallyltransferase MiaA [Ignavibacteriaceae bacterium]